MILFQRCNLIVKTLLGELINFMSKYIYAIYMHSVLFVKCCNLNKKFKNDKTFSINCIKLKKKLFRGYKHL